MTPRHSHWYVRQRHFLSPDDLAEVRAAQPDYLIASFVMDRHDQHRCVLYLRVDERNFERVAEGQGATAIEAFRAACSRIEVLPMPQEFATWRGCVVEVA